MISKRRWGCLRSWVLALLIFCHSQYNSQIGSPDLKSFDKLVKTSSLDSNLVVTKPGLSPPPPSTFHTKNSSLNAPGIPIETSSKAPIPVPTKPPTKASTKAPPTHESTLPPIEAPDASFPPTKAPTPDSTLPQADAPTTSSQKKVQTASATSQLLNKSSMVGASSRSRIVTVPKTSTRRRQERIENTEVTPPSRPRRENAPTSRSNRLQISNITALPRSDRSIEVGKAIYGEQLYLTHFDLISHTYQKNNQPKRHLLLHIGKAGGTSLESSNLQLKKPMAILHGNHLRHSSTDLALIDDFLVVLRSPIDRLVSWFYFEMMHMQKKQGTHWKVAPTMQKVFSCFPEVHDLVHALTDTLARCHQLALHIAHGLRPDGISHMFHNSMFYTRQGLLKRPELPVYVMRTKHLWSDFSKVFGDPGEKVTGVKADHGTVKSQHNSSIPSHLLRPLCCALVEELDVYRYILYRAANNVSANATVTQALSQCNVTSLEQLVDECPNYLLHPNYQDPGTNVSLSIQY